MADVAAVNAVYREGWLVKKAVKTLLKQSWKRRFFVLRNGVLSYSDAPGGKSKGDIRLEKSAKVRRVDVHASAGHRFELELVSGGTTLYACGESDAEADAWVADLQRVITALDAERIRQAEALAARVAALKEKEAPLVPAVVSAASVKASLTKDAAEERRNKLASRRGSVMRREALLSRFSDRAAKDSSKKGVAGKSALLGALGEEEEEGGGGAGGGGASSSSAPPPPPPPPAAGGYGGGGGSISSSSSSSSSGSSGDDFVADLAEGRIHRSVWMCGLHDQGQVGDGQAAPGGQPRMTKVDVLKPPRAAAELNVGGAHVLAVTVSGEVFVWGCGTSGQLGVDRSAKRMLRPFRLPLSQRVPVAAVAAGDAHSLALTETGQVLAWGSNARGQCGVRAAAPGGRAGGGALGGRTRLRKSVVEAASESEVVWEPQVLESLDADGDAESLLEHGEVVVALRAGSTTSAALTDKGRLFVWGDASLGKLGLGAAAADGVVRAPMCANGCGAIPEAALVLECALGEEFSLALFLPADGDEDEEEEGEGEGEEGGGKKKKVVSGGKKFSKGEATAQTVAGASVGAACVLVQAGRIGRSDRAWAEDEERCAEWHLTETFGSRAAVVAVDAGPLSAVALTASGGVFTWGEGALGRDTAAVSAAVLQEPSAAEADGAGGAGGAVAETRQVSGIAVGAANMMDAQPGLVPALGLAGISAVSAGTTHMAAVSVGGFLYVWGDNSKGQLCTGDFGSAREPRAVPPPAGQRFLAVRCSSEFTAAVLIPGAASRDLPAVRLALDAARKWAAFVDTKRIDRGLVPRDYFTRRAADSATPFAATPAADPDALQASLARALAAAQLDVQQ